MFGFLNKILGNKGALAAMVAKKDTDSCIIILPDKVNGQLKILQSKWHPLEEVGAIKVIIGKEVNLDAILNLDQQIIDEETKAQLPPVNEQ